MMTRDDWCTPDWLWRMFDAPYDLDPCSNPWSTVPAMRECTERGEYEVLRRDETAWLNPPYSRGSSRAWFEWATEQARHGAHVYGVVRFDPSTLAWRKHGPRIGWIPAERIEFVPPPGIESSKPMHATCAVLWSHDPLRVDGFRDVVKLSRRLGVFVEAV